MVDIAFKPNVIEANVGDVIEIVATNKDPIPHDFTIEEIPAEVHISYLAGDQQHEHATPTMNDADVHFALTEPGAGIIHLKVLEPGEYTFYCTVPGHREAGMEGKLIVR